jgi:hypothetical protein
MPDIRGFMLEMKAKEAEKVKVLEVKKEVLAKPEKKVTKIKIEEKF